MFNATQYISAPRLLTRIQCKLKYYGNFSRPADFAAIGRQHRLVIEQDFQNGVVLFRRRGRQVALWFGRYSPWRLAARWFTASGD